MRMWATVILASLPLAAALSQSQPAATVADRFSVPFQLIRGHIYVHALVDGKGPYTFVFDTGASGMGRADVRLVALHSLKKVGQDLNSDGINVRPIDVVAVQSLRLGTLEKKNVELLSRDYNLNRRSDRPIVMGIFGADFFADHLLTIDYPARTLLFSKGSLNAAEPGVVAYGEDFAIPVCVKSGCYTAKIDTGSSSTIVIPKGLVGKVEASKPIPAGTGTRANTVSQMYAMNLQEPMKVAGVVVRDVKIVYADPSDDDVNIGSNFLKDYVLTIDSRNRLLRIEPPRTNLGERG